MAGARLTKAARMHVTLRYVQEQQRYDYSQSEWVLSAGICGWSRDIEAVELSNVPRYEYLSLTTITYGSSLAKAVKHPEPTYKA